MLGDGVPMPALRACVHAARPVRPQLGVLWLCACQRAMQPMPKDNTMLKQRKTTQNEAVSLLVRRASDPGAQPGSPLPPQAASKGNDSKEPLNIRLPAPTFAVGYLCTGTALAVLGQVVTNQVRHFLGQTRSN